MLSERTAITVIVEEDGQMFVCEDTMIERDGVVVARDRHRKPLEPGADVKDEHPRVQALAAAAWTPDIVDAFAQRKAAEVAKHSEPLSPLSPMK